MENREELIAAVNNDYGTRSRFETSLSELLSMQVGVLETIRHLKVWMKPRNRHLKALDFMLKVKSYTPSKGKIMEEHDLVGLPRPGDEVDVAKLEKSRLVRSGLLINDLDVGDEVVLRWLNLFADPMTWRAELLEQQRLGEAMAGPEDSALGREFLDYMGELVTAGLEDPRLDAYSRAIREVLSTGHLGDWSRLDGVLAPD